MEIITGVWRLERVGIGRGQSERHGGDAIDALNRVGASVLDVIVVIVVVAVLVILLVLARVGVGAPLAAVGPSSSSSSSSSRGGSENSRRPQLPPCVVAGVRKEKFLLIFF